MAIVRAIASGNWSNTAIWNTGALPTSADDVYANTFTVTIDISPTVLSISNAAFTGVTAGGGFVISANGITVTCTSNPGISAGTVSSCLSITTSAGSLTQIFANLTGGQGRDCIVAGSTGTISVVGNVTGNIYGSATGGHGINVTNACTVNITGSVYGGVSGSNQAYGVQNGNAGAIVNITGSCYAPSVNSFGNNFAVINASTGTVNIIGSCYSSSSGSSPLAAVNNASTGTINVTGSIVAYLAAAFTSSSQSAVNILSGPFITSASGLNPIIVARWFWANSNVTPTYYQVRTANLATIRPLYTADSVGGNPAASNVRSGTVYGPSNELTGTCAVPPAGSVALGVPVDNTTGTAVLTQANFQSALDAQGLTSSRAAKLDNLDATVSSRLASASYTAPLDAAGTRTAVGLATANLDTQFTNIPANVRTNLSPELGRIDTTVSSRLATSGYTTPPTVGDIATAVWNAATSALSNLGSIGKLLVDNINASISSRLASTSYQAPLDAAGTRSAIGLATANLDTQFSNIPANVRTELSPELGRIDVATSTRSTFNPASDTVANVTLVDTTTNLTNPPVVPTTTEIAQAVRVELTPELDRIDADVTSRLAAVDYTTPPTSEQNAQAVRVELSPELDRVSNCATVATTGQQIQNALSI